MKQLVADSPGEIAIRVADVLNDRPGHERYRQLPYNRFDGYLDHLYWLVPGAERVAFSRSKYFVDWWDQDAEVIWSGVHLEKGVGAHAAKSKSDKGLMGKDWAWHSVLPDLGCAGMQAAVDLVSDYLGGTGQLSVMVAPYVEGINRENIQETRFTIGSGAKLALEATEGAQHLGLSKCSTIIDVRDALQTWGEAEWFWVDLFIGFRAKAEAARGADQRAQADELAKRAFIPLEPWVR